MTYHHLIYDQRCQIYALKKRGYSSRSIACDIGVHHSTICRELRRNTGRQGYRYKQAQRFCADRRVAHNCKMDADLISLVEEKLSLQWSPSQISGWFKRHDHARISHATKGSASCETIYQHVWRDKKKGGHLYRHLRRRGKKYNKRSAVNAGRGCIPGRIAAHSRPPAGGTRARGSCVGRHWRQTYDLAPCRKTRLAALRHSFTPSEAEAQNQDPRQTPQEKE